MTDEHQSVSLSERRQESRTPEIGERYWVQCKGYRTMAFMGPDGKWMSVYNSVELPEVVDFFPS